MTNMSVEDFKTKIEKKLFSVLVLIKDLWTWTMVASKVVNFVNYWAKDSLNNGILMRRKLRWC
jgi:hypothetical protein